MKYNILYIEDDTYYVDELRNDIERYNPEFNLLSTCDKSEVLEIIRENEIHIILLDLKLRSWGDLDLFKILDQNDIPLSPIIIVSSYAVKPVITLAIKLGTLAFVEKPFKYHELISQVKQILGSPEAETSDIETSGITEAVV